MYSLELTSGKTAPGTTGMSVRPMISSRRRVCWTSSSRQASPVRTVMPRTSGVGRIDERENGLHVRAARTGGILIDNDFALGLRLSR